MFSYDHSQRQIYSVGITLIEKPDYPQALIATKEKALTDLLMIRRGACSSKKQLQKVLFEDLRIDEKDLNDLDEDLLKEIYQAKPHSAIEYLIQCRKS